MTSKVISNTYTNEQLIKKSLFIGICFHIKNANDFTHQLQQHADPSATHNCWAYRIGQTYRFNDDGEPSGTAGKPILAAIEGAGFDHLGALVIRHYGGIKLGTGGLARAYGGTIAKNLQQAPFQIHVPMVSIRFQIPFSLNQRLFQILDAYEGQVTGQDFNAKGVECIASIPQARQADFKTEMVNISKGQIKFLSESH